jgi:hypothetical protein
MTVDGRITVCKAQFPGNGRCNHISHLKEGESVLDFIASAIQQLLQENKELKDRLKKIEKYIEVLKEQITTKYPNEIPKEILLTHINIILNKIKGDE